MQIPGSPLPGMDANNAPQTHTTFENMVVSQITDTSTSNLKAKTQPNRKKETMHCPIKSTMKSMGWKSTPTREQAGLLNDFSLIGHPLRLKLAGFTCGCFPVPRGGAGPRRDAPPLTPSPLGGGTSRRDGQGCHLTASPPPQRPPFPRGVSSLLQ